MAELTKEIAAKLREPFPPEKVGKLPRVTCGKCRDSRSRVCDDHAKQKCSDCHNWITPAHIHLDYVGHADVTDRLLEADPAWTWEPFALDEHGLPAVDDNGGMWIRLTVAGVTRIGYGDADGKRGGSAVKETIGDALRNASMRFGVGLDLWRKEGVVEESTDQRPTRQRRPPKSIESAQAAEEVKPPDPEMVVLFDAFAEEIRTAKTQDDLTATGANVRAALGKKEITKALYDQLARQAGARRAEINGQAS